MNTKPIFAGLVGLTVMAGASGVCGQEWGTFPYAPTCWGYGYPGAYLTESVPYYALYPPVYYSYRVARTYGYSPFAYPPGVLTPGSQPPRSATVQNVYTASSGETAESQARQPLRIDNPFVEQSTGPGVTKSRKPAGRQPGWYIRRRWPRQSSDPTHLVWSAGQAFLPALGKTG